MCVCGCVRCLPDERIVAGLKHPPVVYVIFHEASIIPATAE